MSFFKKYNIPIWLTVLVLTLSGLSFYNYSTQKNLLLEQMQSDAGDIVNSITAAMKRFHEIKSTMNLQRLMNEVSFGLEIFEFRYLEPDGIIRNSMFKQEIGHIHDVESFKKTMQGDIPLGDFFYEVRDYVPVMAIYYPIFSKKKLIGMIDLAVDITEYDTANNVDKEFSLLRRQVDIMNLLKSIEGSIHNSLAIYEETDFYDFLNRYVDSAENILQITVVDSEGDVVMSSNDGVMGGTFGKEELHPPKLIMIDGRPVYRMVTEKQSFIGDKPERLMLLIDAAPYMENEQRLLHTAQLTTAIALLFALFIARAIYFSALERSREEKERLERLVKERTHEIEMLSKTDALTGLWNRGYLEEMLDMEDKRARRYNHPLAILIIDLDHFKKVNDNFGHMAGDEVLRQASLRIKSRMRETDFVGRYGGEEIVVILPETTLETATEIAETIRMAIAESPVLSEGHSIDVTASIGISELRKEHQDHQQVFSEADEALYASKAKGRNCVTVFRPKQETT